MDYSASLLDLLSYIKKWHSLKDGPTVERFWDTALLSGASCNNGGVSIYPEPGVWARVASGSSRNDIFDGLFGAKNFLKSDGGAELSELVLGVGSVNETGAPVFLHPCEIVGSGSSQRIDIKPAFSKTRINSKLLGDKAQGKDAYTWLDEHSHNLLSDPFDSTKFWEAVTKMTDQSSTITNSDMKFRWGFSLSGRPDSRLVGDIDNWVSRLSSISPQQLNDTLPWFIKALFNDNISAPDNGDHNKPLLAGADKKPPSNTRLMFPLPYNKEQASIVGQIDSGPGAILKGPPGTGKSQTIANLVCHYLAQGKKLLVVSTSAGSLEAIYGMLPSPVQNLSMPVLSSDEYTENKFYTIVDAYAKRLSLDDAADVYKKRKEKLLSVLGECQDTENSSARALRDAIVEHTIPLDIGDGKSLPPSECAKLLHEKLAQATLMDGVVPRYSEDIEEFVSAFVGKVEKAAEDLAFKEAASLIPDSVPSLEDMLHAKKAFNSTGGSLSSIRASKKFGKIKNDTTASDAEKLHNDVGEAIKLLKEIGQNSSQLGARPDIWEYTKVLYGVHSDSATKQNILTCIASGKQVMSHTSTSLKITKGFSLSDMEDIEKAEIVTALKFMATPHTPPRIKKATSSKRVRKLLETILIDDVQPKSKDDWRIVKGAVFDMVNADSAITGLAEVEREMRIRPIVGTAIGMGNAKDVVGAVITAYDVLERYNKLVKENLPILLKKVFRPAFADAVKVFEDTADILDETALRDLETEAANALTAVRARSICVAWDERIKATYGVQVAAYISQVFDAALKMDESDASAVWWRVIDGANQARHIREAVLDIDKDVFKLRNIGFSLWPNIEDMYSAEENSFEMVDVLLANLYSPQSKDAIVHACKDRIDDLFSDWRNRWKTTLMCQSLQALSDNETIRRIVEDVDSARSLKESTLADLVGALAWGHENIFLEKNEILALKSGAPQRQKDILEPSGHTPDAMYTKNIIREHYGMIKCWIMPYARVSEYIPNEIGIFDMVIMDEASQSDIRALPALLRAKQLLVVGDDQQVAPSLGISEKSAKVLCNSEEYGKGVPERYVTPGASIYSVYNEIFATNKTTMLEHFRCAPPIIGLSNREFYDGKIMPLRLQKTSEKLGRPLVDVVVSGSGGTDNWTELNEWIAKKILSHHSKWQGRSIGVVLLTDNETAIDRARQVMSAMLPKETWENHRNALVIGTPFDFQGKEKDIVFICADDEFVKIDSSVGENGIPESLARKINVAATRARDKMFLIRHKAGAKRASYLESIIEYFNTQSVHYDYTSERSAAASSDFERDICSHLEKYGFNVTQHPLLRAATLDLAVDITPSCRVGLQCVGELEEGGLEADSRSSYDVALHMAHEMLYNESVLNRVGWDIFYLFPAHFYQDKRGFTQALYKSFGKRSPDGMAAGFRQI